MTDAVVANMPRKAGFTLERVMLVLTFICSFTASVFGLGVQWARTNQVEATVLAIKADYVPREVYQSDQLRFSDAAERLTKAIDDLKGEIKDARAAIVGVAGRGGGR